MAAYTSTKCSRSDSISLVVRSSGWEMAAAAVMGLAVLLSLAALATSPLRIARQQIGTTAALDAETVAKATIYNTCDLRSPTMIRPGRTAHFSL